MVDLHAVQVHPTGLVDPREPDAKVKWLAAEALRGAGGIIIDSKGNRFCDEVWLSPCFNRLATDSCLRLECFFLSWPYHFMCDEVGFHLTRQLGKRDYVTGRMWKHGKGP